MNPKEQKVFLEFFTNIAVAWFSAGVIVSFFSIGKMLDERLFFGAFGAMLSIASLRVALSIAKKEI